VRQAQASPVLALLATWGRLMWFRHLGTLRYNRVKFPMLKTISRNTYPLQCVKERKEKKRKKRKKRKEKSI
jgi:hypothetical protein